MFHHVQLVSLLAPEPDYSCTSLYELADGKLPDLPVNRCQLELPCSIICMLTIDNLHCNAPLFCWLTLVTLNCFALPFCWLAIALGLPCYSICVLNTVNLHGIAPLVNPCHPELLFH